VTPTVTVTPPMESAGKFASPQDTNGHKASTIDEAIADFNNVVGKSKADEATVGESALSAVEADAVAPTKTPAPDAREQRKADNASTDGAKVKEPRPKGVEKRNSKKDVKGSRSGVSTPFHVDTPVDRVGTSPLETPSNSATPSAEDPPFRRPPSGKPKKKSKKKKNTQSQAQAGAEDADGDGQGMDEIDLS
jgi:hypothetical protein